MKDKRFHNNPMKSISGGQFCLIPKAMLDMMAKLNLNKGKNNGSGNTNSTPKNAATNTQHNPPQNGAHKRKT